MTQPRHPMSSTPPHTVDTAVDECVCACVCVFVYVCMHDWQKGEREAPIVKALPVVTVVRAALYE